MKRVLLVVGCIAVMALAVPSWATVWDFKDPPTTGAVGAASWAVTKDGLTLTAYGFDLPGNGAHDLYWKQAGLDEQGSASRTQTPSTTRSRSTSPRLADRPSPPTTSRSTSTVSN